MFLTSSIRAGLFFDIKNGIDVESGIFCVGKHNIFAGRKRGLILRSIELD